MPETTNPDCPTVTLPQALALASAEYTVPHFQDVRSAAAGEAKVRGRARAARKASRRMRDSGMVRDVITSRDRPSALRSA
ncbi:hypothetical protein GCM10023096_57670 [Nonomuraea ferruginea]